MGRATILFAISLIGRTLAAVPDKGAQFDRIAQTEEALVAQNLDPSGVSVRERGVSSFTNDPSLVSAYFGAALAEASTGRNNPSRPVHLAGLFPAEGGGAGNVPCTAHSVAECVKNGGETENGLPPLKHNKVACCRVDYPDGQNFNQLTDQPHEEVCQPNKHAKGLGGCEGTGVNESTGSIVPSVDPAVLQNISDQREECRAKSKVECNADCTWTSQKPNCTPSTSGRCKACVKDTDFAWCASKGDCVNASQECDGPAITQATECQSPSL
jgi:hypothetical protein